MRIFSFGACRWRHSSFGESYKRMDVINSKEDNSFDQISDLSEEYLLISTHTIVHTQLLWEIYGTRSIILGGASLLNCQPGGYFLHSLVCLWTETVLSKWNFFLHGDFQVLLKRIFRCNKYKKTIFHK